MTEPPKLKTGDAVTVRYADRAPLDGVVTLASANARSLALAFEAVLGSWTRVMLVLWDDEAGVYEDVFSRTPVAVLPVEEGT